MRTRTNFGIDGTDSNRSNKVSVARENYASKIELAEVKLNNFAKLFHSTLNPGDPYVGNWHLDFMAEHLEAVLAGDITRLVINVPPGSSKSTLVSCMFGPWAWIRWPESEWGFSSYAQDLSKKFSTARRRIIRDPVYQDAWGHVVVLRDDQDEKLEMENTARGKFKATSTGGSTGGQHFDFIVIDDPQNPEDDNSKIDTERAVEHVKYLANTRLKNKDKSRVILVMQRLNARDSTHALVRSEAGMVHLTIPLIAPKQTTFSFPRSGRIKTLEEKEIFWPSVYSQKFVARQREEMGPIRFAAQMQQDPQEESGKLVNRSWWERFSETSASEFRVWAIDSATKEKSINDYTVFILIRQWKDGYQIEKVVRKRMQAAMLEKEIDDLWAAHPADALVVEDKDSGQRVVQHYKAQKKIPVFGFQPSAYGDKVQRLSLISPLIAAKKIAVPDTSVLPDCEWVADFLDEFDAFPRGAHDDQVDAFTTGMIYLTRERKVGRFKVESDVKAPAQIRPIMPSMNDGPKW